MIRFHSKKFFKIFTLSLAGIFISALCFASGMSPRERESFAAFEKRVADGEPDAIYRMSALLEKGYDSIAPDTIRSIALLRRAAIAGHPAACNYLGYLFQEGKMIEQNTDSAYHYIRLAAEGGHTSAITNLNYYLKEGDSIIFHPEGAISRLSPDPDTTLANAIEFYRKKAYPIAIELLLRIPPDTPRTPQAYALLGEAYSRGRGVQYDYAKALHYYANAAMQGNPSAMFIIAETLEFFPDALSQISIELPDADTLRHQAAKQGITSAEQAAAHLLEIDFAY